MKKCLLIAAIAALLVLSACSGRRPTRCDQWGWYKPCDLVEGQQPCEPNCAHDMYTYKQGQVVSREYAYPVTPTAPCRPSPVPTTGTPAPVVPLD